MRLRLLFSLLFPCVWGSAQPNLYVSTDSAGIHVMDTVPRIVGTTLTGFGPTTAGISTALSPNGTRLYAVMPNGNAVRAYNTTDNSVVTNSSTGPSPRSVVVGPGGTYLYVTRQSGPVDRINTSTGIVNQGHYFPSSATDPVDMVINRAGSRIYIAEVGGTGQIRVLSVSATGTLALVGTIPLQGKPYSLALSVDDQRLYAAGDGISVIDAVNNTVLTRVGVGQTFHTIRVADFYRAYVTATAGTGLFLLELFSHTLQPFLEFPGSRGIAISPDGFRAWVAAASTPAVREVNLATEDWQNIQLPGTALPNFLLLGPGPRPATGCIAELQPTSVELPAAASGHSVAVTLPSDCAWTATSNASWLQVVGSASGTGNGIVTFTAQANPGLASRTGALFIGGKRVIVTQAGQTCSYSISPGSRVAPSATGSGDIDVSAPAGCAWTAVSNVPWIHIDAGANGTGTQVSGVQYSVDPNTSASRRVGTITVARQTYTVTQLGTGPAIECFAFGQTEIVRAEGLAERVGDVVIHCINTAGTTVTVTGDVFLQFNVPLTNRKSTVGSVPDATDSFMLVGEPAPSAIQVGTNAARGFLAGPNRIRYTGQLNIGPNGVIVRIVNLRVNASLVPGGFNFGAIFARVSVRTNSPIPVAMEFDHTVPAVALLGSRAAIGTTGSAGVNAVTVPVQFTEQFETAYRIRQSSCNSPASPGVECNTESGFMNTDKLGLGVGQADHGTRLRVRIPVPSGVKLYAPINNSGTVKATLMSADAAGLGGTALPGTHIFNGTSYRDITPATPGGVATAVWEVTVAMDSVTSETLAFPLVVENATEAQRDEIIRAAIGSLAPVSTAMNAHETAPVPRFLDPQGAPRFVNLRIVSRAIRLGTLSSDGSKLVAVRQAVGSNFVFNYDVYNDSSETATGVVVRGNLPAQFNYTGCSVQGGTCSVSGSDVSATINEIAGGSSASVSIQATQTAEVAAGSLLESRVNVGSNEADADLASNEASSGFLLEDCPANSINPTSASNIPAAGGTGTFNIASQCASWTVRPTADWVTVNVTAGTGAGSVGYTVSPNLTPVARTTTIIAAGQTFTITQAAGAGVSCPLTIDSTGQTSAPAEGRTGQLGVALTAGNCAWEARSNSTWLEVFPLSGNTNSTVSFTVYPNFGSQARTATVTIGAQSVNISQPGMTGTADQRFVRFAYFAALRRLPNPTEEQFHLSRLSAGMTRGQLLHNFIEGPEFKVNGAFVTGLYLVLLGRNPERGGWAFQLNGVVQLGLAQVGLANNFLGSAEWQLEQGGTISDEAFIRLLYQEVLGRPADQAEVDWQVGNLRASSRAQMVTNFLGGAEFFLNRGSRLKALHAYFVILGRDPSAAEVKFVEDQLKAGTSFQDIVTAFVASPEHAALLQ